VGEEHEVQGARTAEGGAQQGEDADYGRLMSWISATGASVGEAAVILDYGRGRQVDMSEYLEACRSAVVVAGGSVLTRAQMHSLIIEAGQVVGVEVWNDGEALALRAPWTLLASGGFQADSELIATYIHPNAPEMPLRSNRASTGDGLRVATEVGAETSEIMDGSTVT
jgi:FAD binding domain